MRGGIGGGGKGESGPVAQGSNIHYSPVDNKPLCSYSSKLCRQRRLNGYGFCIRHILEDLSAPFKQCLFVTRNNSQKCLNAIPQSEERAYCHSHMQVAGMIPKTERKIKPSTTPFQNQQPPPPPSPASKPSKSPNPKTDKCPPVSSNSKPTKKKPSKVVVKVEPLPPPLLNGRSEKESQNGDPSSFEQLKTLKILQKLPIRTREPWSCGAGLRPPHLATESRADFLARVRLAFRTEYKRVRDLVRRKEKEEVRLSVGLRESLLACVLADPSRSAHILSTGEDEVDTLKKKNGRENGEVKQKPINKKATNKPPKEDRKIKTGTLPVPPTLTPLSPLTNGKKSKKKASKKKEIPSSSSSEPIVRAVPLSGSVGGKSKKRKKPMGSGEDGKKGRVEGVEVEKHVLKDYTYHTHNPNLTLNATAPADSNYPTLFPQLSSNSGVTELHAGLGSDAQPANTPPPPFHSPFHNSASAHPECDFSEEVEELEKSFELHIDPEIAHQASRLLEENQLTEDDFNDLFPETTRSLSDHKLSADLGLDSTFTFDPSDIDYSLFANIFPFSRPNPLPDSHNF